MCGIAGILSLQGRPIAQLQRKLAVMSSLLAHRGPDGEGYWVHRDEHVGFAHRRLSVIDLLTGSQPMTSGEQNTVTYNGEVYNYRELRCELGTETFATTSDTEAVLGAYRRWGRGCVEHLRGMFAFAIWDEARQSCFAARDRFGMKPFYYAIVGEELIFASEIKAILPLLPAVETDLGGLRDYLAFQFCMDGKTLFKGVHELPPAHTLRVEDGRVSVERYWEVWYELDWNHTSRYFEERLRELLDESVALHLRSDVPVGSYLSGGLDSSAVAVLASRLVPDGIDAFTGRFDLGPKFDETPYARMAADAAAIRLHETTITPSDFIDNIRSVVYHLDQPVAGPGALPQYIVSKHAREHLKVVLGGQGGDELFGGYARYLVAYFEQCFKAAIDGTMDSGNFVVSYESILPNLTALRDYKPMLQEFWRDGMFEEMDRRYFRLINRATTLTDEINWDMLGDYSPYETFRSVFNAENAGSGSYFDRMTHFDFKTLLPALLHVEDRVSMAHGLESRLPFLDHPLVEIAATIPADVKFEGGQMKRVLKAALRHIVPSAIIERTDKMGFPTPVVEWAKGEARDFVHDVLATQRARNRDLVDNRKVLARLDEEATFGRSFWGLFTLELWQQEFHDRGHEFRALVEKVEAT